MELRSIASNGGTQRVEPAAIYSQLASGYAAVAPANPIPDEGTRHDNPDFSVSDQTIRKAIEKANKALEGVHRRFEYSVHEKTGQTIVKVINQDTDELIREIPNEKFLDLVSKLQELVGLIIDEKR